MNLTNEERLQIAKENGADQTTEHWYDEECVDVTCYKFTEDYLLAAFAAIEAEVEKRVRESCAVICESPIERYSNTVMTNNGHWIGERTAHECAEAIRNGGVKNGN